MHELERAACCPLRKVWFVRSWLIIFIAIKQVGRVFTPLDAVSIAAKAVLQTDLRRAARRVVEWLDANS